MVVDHLRPESSPAARGAELARELDCGACHRAALRGGDPGAPSLFAGSRDPDTLTRRLREVDAHPRDLSPARVAALAAWIALVQYENDRAATPFATEGLAGVEALARRHCFSCHGELGQGGVANPGSLKGYVPGFFGHDYDLLTLGDHPDVVREWIRDGVPRFFHLGVGPLRPALWFTRRQQVKMPGYADRLTPRQQEDLAGYLSLLRRLGPMDAAGVARYRARAGLPVPGATRGVPPGP